MPTVMRRLAAWATAWSLVGGLVLPFQAPVAAMDADGICGPVLTLEHSVEHFETARPALSGDHCVFCHWWTALASASASSAPVLAPPPDRSSRHLRASLNRTSLVVAGDAAPRAPPSAFHS